MFRLLVLGHGTLTTILTGLDHLWYDGGETPRQRGTPGCGVETQDGLGSVERRTK